MILAPGLSTNNDIIIHSAWTITPFSYHNHETFPSFLLSSLLSSFKCTLSNIHPVIEFGLDSDRFTS